MKQYESNITGVRKAYKTQDESVWLNKKVIGELNQLLELYYKEHSLMNKMSISRCCNIGLMMMASLSVDELYDVIRWYKNYYE